MSEATPEIIVCVFDCAAATGAAVHVGLPPGEDAERLPADAAAEPGGAAAEVRRLQPQRVRQQSPDPHEGGETCTTLLPPAGLLHATHFL